MSSRAQIYDQHTTKQSSLPLPSPLSLVPCPSSPLAPSVCVGHGESQRAVHGQRQRVAVSRTDEARPRGEAKLPQEPRQHALHLQQRQALPETPSTRRGWACGRPRVSESQLVNQAFASALLSSSSLLLNSLAASDHCAKMLAPRRTTASLVASCEDEAVRWCWRAKQRVDTLISSRST